MVCLFRSGLFLLVWLCPFASQQTVRSAAAFQVPTLQRCNSAKIPKLSSSSVESSQPSSSLVVISPPGGIGEVTAVKAATMGSSVKWFVVSDDTKNVVVLSQEALAAIDEAGGKVEVAGADVDSLLLPVDDPQSAISSVSMWTGRTVDGIVCTEDGVKAGTSTNTVNEYNNEDHVQRWKDAIKIVTKEASASVSTGTKLAILSATEDLYNDEDGSDDTKNTLDGGIGNLVGSLFGGGSSVPVPATIVEALGGNTGGSSKVTSLRHGQLFGKPESSPDFSPFVGGPKRDVELCEEYTTRSVRIDPTVSMSGNLMMGSATKSSRHSVGEAAALILLGRVPAKKGMDVCLSSQLGTETVPLELWKEEFERSAKMLSEAEAGSKAVAPQLFSASFSSVPNVERLADWLATKWAPAILRTYDIAAIRVGARPVYAARTGEGKVEIVWQELVNFESVEVGRMILQVSETGIVATRGAGDAKKGYGKISRKPLAGEDVLVRTLPEAASQAIEKGLAQRPVAPSKKKEPKGEKPTPVVTAVSSLQSSGTVVVEKAKNEETTGSGPRQAGARRSTERARGSRRRKSSASSKPPSEMKE